MAQSEEDLAIMERWKAQRDKLNVMIAAFEDFIGVDHSALGGAGQRIQRASGPQDIASDAFLKMTIPQAAQKYLEMTRTPQPIGQIWEALKRGGLPHAQYNAVYTAIWRREAPKGIFFRPEDGNAWGLAEWYPSNPNVKKKAKAEKRSETKGEARSGPKPTVKPKLQSQTVTLVDGCEQILKAAGQPLHISDLLARLLEQFGKTTNSPNLSGTLRKDDRFRNLGKNLWALAEWSREREGGKRAEEVTR